VKRSLGQNQSLCHAANALLPQIQQLRHAGKSYAEIGQILSLTRFAVVRALERAERAGL
jgi:hypothetical protein